MNRKARLNPLTGPGGIALVLGALLIAATVGRAIAAREPVVRVAVAANFAATLEALSKHFEAKTGDAIHVSAASSGQLFAQIRAGAPYDIFLSADTKRTRDLIRAGRGVSGSEFVYARGKLVLWSGEPSAAGSVADALSQQTEGVLALADPRTAPYGAAAVRLLKERGEYERLRRARRISLGSSVTQVYQYVQTGGATLGFVALSQVVESPRAQGTFWEVPTAPGELDQEAVLLQRGAGSKVARAFMAYLKDDPYAKALVERHGYAAP